jgi:hypothetical protein
VKPINVDLLLRVGVALSKEKDDDVLFETILTAAMDITHCDGGTLYVKTDDALVFRTMITRSRGIRKTGKDEPIELPPVPLSRRNACARAALDGAPINVPDVRKSGAYDFAGPREYDAITGYGTVSMLVVPMEDDLGETIGVLQLINAMDDEGGIAPFDPGYEPVIRSLASQAAICLTNKNYAAEAERLMDSFVRVMSTAIDERSPYNANHTRNMVKYAERFMDRLRERGDARTFTSDERRQFLMSVWLHDVGKLVIPLEIMDKPTRLGGKLRDIEHRFEILALQAKIAFLEGRVGEAERDARTRALDEGLTLIRGADGLGFLPDEIAEQIKALAARTGETAERRLVPLLEQDELRCLTIRKGTLTDEERGVMESHASGTAKLLGQMAFSKQYKHVPEWAAAHHESLDGTGYPNGLAGDAIPWEVRLLTILDVFDALTASDRPYKPAMPTAGRSPYWTR